MWPCYQIFWVAAVESDYKLMLSFFPSVVMYLANFPNKNTFMFQVEKKRLLHVFIKQFVVVYKDWEPVNSGILLESASVENFSSADDVIIGCSAGHPVEVIRVFVDEVTQLSSLVTECKMHIIAILVFTFLFLK